MPEIVWPQVAAGAALCLVGWTFYWLALNLTGAVAGALLGAGVGAMGVEMAQASSAELWWIPALGGIGGFIAGIFLMRGLHRFLFFFGGAAFGVAIGQAAYDFALVEYPTVATNPLAWRVGLIVAGSVLCGLLALWGSRWIVALATSVVGALLIALAIHDPLALLVAVPLVPASFFFQMGLLKRVMAKPKRRAEVETDEE